MTQLLRIATRASNLALWQSERVRDLLLEATPNLMVELVPIVSTGDVVRDRPLHQLGGVGVFTKEVQEAVLAGEADIAVHSLKDLPTRAHPELALAAVPERGPTGDALIAPTHGQLSALPIGAKVATSSLRRRAQLLRRRPDLTIVDVRGNVETRLRKLREEGWDAIVLAEAGLVRLGLAGHVTDRLGPDTMLPAAGQGALGIECRVGDAETRNRLAILDHFPTRWSVEAERAFLRALEGGCQAPIGALAHWTDVEGVLEGVVLSVDGDLSFAGRRVGVRDAPSALGEALAHELLDAGADAIVQP